VALPDLDDWEPWRPADLATRLAGLDLPRYVADWRAGALDLVHPGHAWRDRLSAVPGD
jgi:hypothetical protein